MLPYKFSAKPSPSEILCFIMAILDARILQKHHKIIVNSKAALVYLPFWILLKERWNSLWPRKCLELKPRVEIIYYACVNSPETLRPCVVTFKIKLYFVLYFIYKFQFRQFWNIQHLIVNNTLLLNNLRAKIEWVNKVIVIKCTMKGLNLETIRRSYERIRS